MSGNLKIATKIPLFIALAAFLSCSAAGVIGVIIAKQSFRTVAEEKLLAVASARKDVLADYFESVRADADILAGESRTITAFEDLKAGNLGSADMYQSAYNTHYQHFEHALRAYGFSDVILMDKTGNVIFVATKKAPDATDSEAFAELYRQAVDTNQPALFSDFKDGKANVVVPLVMDDVAIGLLVAQINSDKLNHFLASYDGLGETGEVFLMSARGEVLNNVRFPEKQTLFSGIAVDASQSQTGIADLRDRDGSEILAAYTVFSFMGNQWILIVNQKLGEIMASISDMPLHIALASILVLTGVLIFGFMMARTITHPLKYINDTLIAISRNDPNAQITYTDRSDEIGDLGRSALIFKQNIDENRQLEQTQKDSETRTRDDRIKARRDLADRFELRVQTIIQTVAAAAKELSSTAASLDGLIENMNAKANNVTYAANEASHNVQSVAAAIEQMSATTREIAQQITKSSSTVKEAVTHVQKADTTSTQLEKATKSIGEIVVFIQSIAKQINLLALNATIESARAGEAGKGFAVVAGEVKNLATQTSKATEQISGDVQSIQKVSGDVVHALRSVKSSISAVDEYSSAMAGAVEEQSMATNEIASNMGNAAVGTTRISDDINDVSQSTGTASSAAQNVLESAKMLSSEAEKLSQEVKLFLNELRQG